jgi:hypothetical protein
MSTSPTGFPKIRATIYLDMEPANVMDMHTLWLNMGVGIAASLAQDVPDQNVTQFVFQQPAPFGILDKTLLVDDEPVSVVHLSDDGLTATVVRWRDAFPFMTSLPSQPKDSHKSGTGLMQLRYSTPWSYIAYRYLLPNFQDEVRALGEKAATFGTLASGSLAIAA